VRREKSGLTITVFHDHRTMYDDAVYLLALLSTIITLTTFLFMARVCTPWGLRFSIGVHTTIW
jgi:hypothetical protein